MMTDCLWWEGSPDHTACFAVIRASADWMLQGHDLDNSVVQDDSGIGEQLWAVYEGLA